MYYANFPKLPINDNSAIGNTIPAARRGAMRSGGGPLQQYLPDAFGLHLKIQLDQLWTSFHGFPIL